MMDLTAYFILASIGVINLYSASQGKTGAEKFIGLFGGLGLTILGILGVAKSW